MMEVVKILDVLPLSLSETSQQLYAQTTISAFAKEDYSFILEILEVSAGEEVK
jgi:hypothetical protein